MYPSQQQLAYAPTPYGYTPSQNLTATINLDAEVRLADTAAERDLYESLAEIYSIIVTLDALEKAYLRDSIPEHEYTETCDRLLRQYRNCLGDENVEQAFGDLERFKQEWDLDAPKATERLRIGLPATLSTDPTSTAAGFPPSRASSQRNSNLPHPLPYAPAPGTSSNAQAIVTASENFITLFDALRLNMLSKDTLHPILAEIIQAVNKVTDREFEDKGKIVQWLITLNQMRPAEELNEIQSRELQWDLGKAYEGFKATLE